MKYLRYLEIKAGTFGCKAHPNFYAITSTEVSAEVSKAKRLPSREINSIRATDIIRFASKGKEMPQI
jgi:hypothetical protein